MPPKLKYCLFCGVDCSPEGEGDDLPVKLDIPGSGRCETLNRQLENWFVARVLLEVDISFLLSELPEEDHPLTWFRLCEGCRETEVKPALAAHQKLLRAQEELREVRGRVRNAMQETIGRRLRKHKDWGGWWGNKMEARIRRQVFKDRFGGTPAAPEGTKREEAEQCRPKPSYGDRDEGDTPALQDDDWQPPDDLPDSPDEAEQENAAADDADEDDLDYRPSKKRKRYSPSKKPKEETKKRVRIRKNRKKKPRPVEQIKRIKCSECGSLLKPPEYPAHLEAHEKSKAAGGLPFDCPQCSFPCTSATELATHTYARHQRKKFRCPKCPGFMVKTWIKLSAHILSEHPAVTEEERDDLCNRCTLCQRQFVDRGHLILHRLKMHPTVTLAGEATESSTEPLPCSECPQRFASELDLKSHINAVHKTSDERKRFVCEECGKGFAERSKLTRHQLSHTRKIKRDYVCHLCGVDYAYPDLLTEHHRRYHPDNPQGDGEVFKCRHCDLTSPFKVVITRHLKTHKEESGWRCGECGNAYMSEVSLKRHLRINHTKEEVKVPCPQCGKEFPDHDYMKTHLTKHCKLKGVAPPPREEEIGKVEMMQDSCPEDALPLQL